MARREVTWRSFSCPADGQGCGVEFEDPGLMASGRDALYYARAVQQ